MKCNHLEENMSNNKSTHVLKEIIKNTVYVMKQGTHIQFQLVTMYYEGIKKNTVDYFMLFLKTCLLVTLDSFNSIYLFILLQKEGLKCFCY